MDDSERIAKLERDVIDLKRVAINPVFGMLEWLAKEARKDVARIEAAQGETRGKLLATEAMLRALLTASPPSTFPVAARAFEQCLLQADADLVALALSEPACRVARDALTGAAEAWRALLMGAAV